MQRKPLNFKSFNLNIVERNDFTVYIIQFKQIDNLSLKSKLSKKMAVLSLNNRKENSESSSIIGFKFAILLSILKFMKTWRKKIWQNFVCLRTEFDVALRLYRGPLLYIIFVFLMGINVYGWRSSGVNHVLIFELDPRYVKKLPAQGKGGGG